MSSLNNHAEPSILLPEASISVFSRDQDTLVAARALADDWRFARVNIDARDGDAAMAGSVYKDAPSPDLVIVQTDTIDDAFAADLEVLASSCEENTAAVVIGPVNDVYLYRKLIDMGVSDYLVRPVTFSMLADVASKILIERKGLSNSNLIAFIGAKGGVGATALAVAAAWGAADIMGQKTVLVDAAGGWSSLSVHLGFEPSTTLSLAARAAANRDEDSIKRMLHKAGDKLSVLASGGDGMLSASVTHEQMENLINVLMVKYPVVIVDLSHAPPDVVRAIAGRANQMILVSSPSLASLRLARTLAGELRDLRGKDDKGIDLVINMQGIATSGEASRKDIEQAMEFKVSAMVPFLPKIFIAAESESKKIMMDKEGQGIVKTALIPILSRVISGAVLEDEGTPAKGGFLNNILSGFKKKK
jgi:pilus assembly protein CpaE